MKRRWLAVSALAGALLVGGAAQAVAAPGGGPAFGQHVAGEAPDHPTEDGRAFGQCVSAEARGVECPH